jgi:DNA mismatch endonuclease (patch repair protein)
MRKKQMTDHEHRSWNMSRIRSKDTKPEIRLRSSLHRIGFRFRKNDKKLPGKPDIVLPKYRTIILVHGCYWHRHEGCKRATTPKSNTEFWIKKFKRNIARDEEVKSELESMGWHVIIVWECEISSQVKLKAMGNELARLLKS